MQNQKNNGLILGATGVVILALMGLAAASVAPVIGRSIAAQRQAGEESPLQLLVTSSDRRKLTNGSEMVALTGRIVNPTAQRQSVPPLMAELRGRDGRVIHKWTIESTVTQIDANASVEFRNAELDIPPNGDQLTVTIGSP